MKIVSNSGSQWVYNALPNINKKARIKYLVGKIVNDSFDVFAVCPTKQSAKDTIKYEYTEEKELKIVKCEATVNYTFTITK